MIGVRTFVCVGGGGVGKTTTSAALALALARQGHRTLVVTIDPARRLADALGVPIGPEPHVVSVDPEAGDRLSALMPDPGASTELFMKVLFEDSPGAIERLENNSLYKALLDALAGMHEVVCMALIQRAAAQSNYQAIVIDTAPSRHAIDFVGYPARLLTLLEGTALTFLANMASPGASAGGPLAWARRGVETALGKVLGHKMITDLSGIFTEMAGARARFSSFASGCDAVLSGPSTRYLLVTAPTGSGIADARFLESRLRKLNLRAHAVVLNRADVAEPAFAKALADVQQPKLRRALDDLEAERRARTAAADRAQHAIATWNLSMPRLRLPLVAGDEPADIVRRLSRELDPHLDLLSGAR